MLKIPSGMIEILIAKIQQPFPAQFPPASLVGICCNQQETLVDESRMIRTQTGSTINHKMIAVAWDALYDTTP
jgi:hypothetical protein